MSVNPNDVEVLVVGGGTAGTIAAIQAGRAGAKTMLAEFTGQLGGTTTTGGIHSVSLFGAHDTMLIAGIGWELVKRCCKETGDGHIPDPTKPKPNRPGTNILINPWLYPALAEEAALEAGVDIHYHTWVSAASWDDASKRWRVTLTGKNEQIDVTCRELIDCTGGAEVVGLLGYQRVRGEPDDENDVQPGTLVFKFAGYDVSTLDRDAIHARFEQAMADGTLRRGDWAYQDRGGNFCGFLGSGGVNHMHVHHVDDTTSAGQTAANIAGRTAMLRLLRFIRTLPGCEQAYIAYAKQDTAIRETYRIVGETTITEQDYLTGRVFPDAVGYTYWFVDIHTESGTILKFLEPGVFPTLPLSALIPRGSQHLLVAGRSISSDRVANSALRIQCSCMAMGQAAGAAAALGVQTGVASRDVPIASVRELLAQHDAILPPLD